MKRFWSSALVILAVTASAAAALAGDACLSCHEKETPGIVKFWRGSAHFQKHVGCIDCHGKDPDASHNRTAVVDASKCGACHRAELMSHRASKHGIALKAGGGCTRNQKKTVERQKSCAICHKPDSAEPLVKTDSAMFLAQSPEMRRQGCTACHLVEARCDTCHTKHGTDLAFARDPGACGTCHMGPDHPQEEMWATSRHGVLYKQGGKELSPSCVTCHMRAGSHNVSRGVSTGVPKGAGGGKNEEREFMLAVCSQCHTRDFAARNLADADRIKEQSSAMVEEARQIIEGLQKDGLLLPSPLDRPAHPLFGKTFIIGPQMLYEGLSSVESSFFKMKTFYAAIAYKGAFHQNPDYAHWYGNAPLKLALSEIRSEAALLRRIDTLKKRLDNLGMKTGEGNEELRDITEKLRALNEQRLKAEISEQEYQERKNAILDEKGL
jgi:hydroxylamine dehydrogenase